MKFFSLIPVEIKFFELLIEHAKGVHKATLAFEHLVQTWEPNHPSILLMRDLEHESDMTTHEILDKLNRTFVTPLDREDIYVLAKQLDDVVDTTHKVTDRMQLFGIKKSSEVLIELAFVLNQATGEVVKAISSIQHLNRPKRILDYCIEINRLENLGDRLNEKALLSLFQNEKDAIEVLKWKEIYDLVENGINICEDVANTIESIVVKYG